MKSTGSNHHDHIYQQHAEDKSMYGTIIGQAYVLFLSVDKSINVCKTKKLPCFMIKTGINIFILFCILISSAGSVSMHREHQPAPSGLRTVVIDPGHGGKDPGAIGKLLKEKDLVLSVSLKLGALIKKNFPDVKVIYTRDKDEFVELFQRAKIANSNNADLFISIHANAVESTAPYGVETFVLGLHKTEAQKEVAERENATIYLEDDKGDKYKDFDMSPDAIIARSIMLKVFLDQSIHFASLIQNEFRTLGRSDRGVKQAGFLVLFKTTVPAVLVELGFLSNPNEERYLHTTEGQQNLANALFDAFVKYKSQVDGVEYLVKSTNSNSKPKENPISDTPQPVSQEGIVFRVQIDTSKESLPKDHPRFKGKSVYEYKQDGLFKYTVGAFTNDFDSANKLKNELRKEGFEYAFVVAFEGSERINLEKAIKLATK
jgi:N-acetylmuramoyl-L-alanine amidase